MNNLNVKILFVFLHFAFLTNMFGQLPDLAVSLGSFEPSSVSRGELLTIHATVFNSGSDPSGSCRLAFYISQNSTITDGYLLGSVSVAPLDAGNSSNDIEFVIPVPQYVLPGIYYVGWNVDPYNEVSESNETNGFYLPATQLTITSGIIFSQHIPFPMIFIHGLNSSDSTWSELSSFLSELGWSNGGSMDFCLNMDNNLSTSLLANDYHDFTNEANLKPADFYFVNFDVNPNGSVYSNTVESNQSAIVKQGVAIHDAVQHVLNVTKREKVILVGHSMGGLAAREYLQNTFNWQIDGQHHIAKVLTIGTPHGGTDATCLPVTRIDCSSEALRDLRKSYLSGPSGVYLLGGYESYITSFYWNRDVNCNGFNVDSIWGLNQKSIYNSNYLPYSCIIGIAGLTGDGLVNSTSQNLNNFYNFSLKADTFQVNAWHSKELAGFLGTGEGSELEKIEELMKGLDEPTYFNQSYRINFDSLYFGLITKQSKGSLLFPDSTDYDDYEFNVTQDGLVHINVRDIPTSLLKAEIFDSLYNSVITKQSGGKSQIDTTALLPPGKYFLEISGLSDAYSWYSPYAFKVTFTQSTPVANNDDGIPKQYSLFQNYPNPFNPTTTISFETPEERFITLKIYDVLGREMESLVNEKKPAGKYYYNLDCSTWPSGIYFYRIQAGSFDQTKKLVLMK